MQLYLWKKIWNQEPHVLQTCSNYEHLSSQLQNQIFYFSIMMQHPEKNLSIKKLKQ